MPSSTDEEIERATRGQSDNPRWIEERKYRLTASTFYEILHARDPEHCADQLYKRKASIGPAGLAACKFGLEAELPAMRLYAEQMGHKVGRYFQPGLCVNSALPDL